jgi:capsid portal protein
MIDTMTIGRVILDEHMTGQNYLDCLQNGLPEQLQDVPLDTRIARYFQDDRAPSHYTQLMWQQLTDTLHNR